MYCVVVGLSSAQGIEQILAYLRNTVKGDRDSVDNAPESKRIFFGGGDNTLPLFCRILCRSTFWSQRDRELETRVWKCLIDEVVRGRDCQCITSFEKRVSSKFKAT